MLSFRSSVKLETGKKKKNELDLVFQKQLGSGNTYSECYIARKWDVGLLGNATRMMERVKHQGTNVFS